MAEAVDELLNRGGLQLVLATDHQVPAPCGQLLLQVLGLRSTTVHEEAIMCVGAMADALAPPADPPAGAATEAEFIKYMDSFMPHLQQGLGNWEAADVCRAAVGVVGDLCRALQENVAGYCDIIVQKLLEALQAPNLDRAVKPEILAALGDIAMAIGEHFIKYLPFTMTMLMQAAASEMPDDAVRERHSAVPLFI